MLLYSGAAVALVITNFCQPLFLIGYVWIRKQHKQTWDGEFSSIDYHFLLTIPLRMELGESS